MLHQLTLKRQDLLEFFFVSKLIFMVLIRSRNRNLSKVGTGTVINTVPNHWIPANRQQHSLKSLIRTWIQESVIKKTDPTN
jgi:hypothetical protein